MTTERMTRAEKESLEVCEFRDERGARMSLNVRTQAVPRIFADAVKNAYRAKFSIAGLMSWRRTASIWSMDFVTRREPNQSSQHNAMDRPFSAFESRSSRG